MHLRRLISAYVIGFLLSIIFRLATNEISIFKLVSVSEETGLSLAFSETPKTVFLTPRPICHLLNESECKRPTLNSSEAFYDTSSGSKFS